MHEISVKCLVSSRIPSPFGTYRMHLYKNSRDSLEHLAFVFGDLQSVSLNAFQVMDTPLKRSLRGADTDAKIPACLTDPVIVRIHSCCFTGETGASLRCDCGEQLQESMRAMQIAGKGVIVYLKQEGRGIGLHQKLLAYNLIDQGHDTLSANIELGHEPDLRTYSIAAQILFDFQISSVNLMTNNPHKISQIEALGIKVVERIQMAPKSWGSVGSEHSAFKDRDEYLMTKIELMGHILTVPPEIQKIIKPKEVK